MKYLLPSLAVAAIAGIPSLAFAWSPGVASPMPSKGFTVNTADRNDVISFYQAVYKASEGFEARTIWKDYPSSTTYEANFNSTYTYKGLTDTDPVLKSTNGPRASGELRLDFVKDVERRVNFYRALAGVPAVVSLMNSDTVKNSSTIVPVTGASPNRDPALTVTKADAVQQSAYMISTTYIKKYPTYSSLAIAHEPSDDNIPNLWAWNKEVWNAHRHSNTTYGYYGPTAINKYMWEDVSGTNNDGSAKTNVDVPHRRKILMINATNFATGDIPGDFARGSNPVLRLPANALYHMQQESEKSDAPARFVSYPNNGYFPAPLNSPYWSLTHPDAVFTDQTVITMTNSGGGNLAISNKTLSSHLGEKSISWKVHTFASERNPTEDRTIHVTVSNFLLSGVSASHSFSVTLINPENVTPEKELTGSNQPPANGTAAYALPANPGVEAIQVNSFQPSDAPWTETAEVDPAPGIINRTFKTIRNHAGYPLQVNPTSFTSFPVVASGKAFRLTNVVQRDSVTNTLPDEIFEMEREILPGTGGTLQFRYRRGYMTTANSLVVEISSDQGVTWQALGASIPGTGSPFTGSAPTWTGSFPVSTVPYRVRFCYRYDNSGNGIYDTITYPTQPTGIFLDDIKTTNCKWMELKKSNEVVGDLTKFTLNNTNAGVTLTNGQAVYLRARPKLGNTWMRYGQTKLVTPTSTPLAGFAGWAAYDYPELTGGFGGDHNGDGVANAVAFAFHQNPTQASNSADTITRSADTISIERSIPSQRSGLTYKAEWSDTMLPGSWSETGVSVTFPSGKVVATAPVGPAGKRFIRWKFDE